MDTTETPGAPVRTLYPIGDGRYVFDATDVGTLLELSQVRRDRNGELRGNLLVKCILAGARTLTDGTRVGVLMRAV